MLFSCIRACRSSYSCMHTTSSIFQTFWNLYAVNWQHTLSMLWFSNSFVKDGLYIVQQEQIMQKIQYRNICIHCTYVHTSCTYEDHFVRSLCFWKRMRESMWTFGCRDLNWTKTRTYYCDYCNHISPTKLKKYLSMHRNFVEIKILSQLVS